MKYEVYKFYGNQSVGILVFNNKIVCDWWWIPDPDLNVYICGGREWSKDDTHQSKLHSRFDTKAEFTKWFNEKYFLWLL